MSTVTDLGQSQGMAWARSAGSCFTSSPLAELQEWQGGSKTPAIPVSLEATTGDGWKSRYETGEKLSLDGLTLTIHYSDGSKKSYKKPFDNEFSFSPNEGSRLTEQPTLVVDWRKEDYHLRTQMTLAFVNSNYEITVDGPERLTYALGEKLSLEGLVVKANWGLSPAGEEIIPEKLGAVTDGYTMMLDNNPFTSETIPAAFTEAGTHNLLISYVGQLKAVAIKWMALQPAITKITRIDDSFSPDWGYPIPEIALTELPPVTANLEDGSQIDWAVIYILASKAEPRQIFIEARYNDIEKTVVLSASMHNLYNAKLNGVIEGHKINAYRYLYGATQSTSTPVSEWLSITPPTA